MGFYDNLMEFHGIFCGNFMFFMGSHGLNGGFMGYDWNLEDLRLRLVGDDFLVIFVSFF